MSDSRGGQWTGVGGEQAHCAFGALESSGWSSAGEEDGHVPIEPVSFAPAVCTLHCARWHPVQPLAGSFGPLYGVEGIGGEAGAVVGPWAARGEEESREGEEGWKKRGGPEQSG